MSDSSTSVNPFSAISAFIVWGGRQSGRVTGPAAGLLGQRQSARALRMPLMPSGWQGWSARPLDRFKVPDEQVRNAGQRRATGLARPGE